MPDSELAEAVSLEVARRFSSIFPVRSTPDRPPLLNSLFSYSSLVVLYGSLSQIYESDEWDLMLHDYISCAIDMLQFHGIPNASLFGGLGGICFAVTLAGKKKNRYEKLQHSLDKLLIEQTRESYITPIKENIMNNNPSHPGLYDVVAGIAGIGNYYLKNLEKPGFKEMAKEVLATLVFLCSSLEVHGKKVPGWYCRMEDEFLLEDRKRLPLGGFNLGFAHGIPGVLAFLSLSLIKGVTVDGQQQLIHKLSHWIWNKRSLGNKGPFWKDRVPFKEVTENKSVALLSSKSEYFSKSNRPVEKELRSEVKETMKPTLYFRDAWCYGTPGVARALFLAGKALNDKGIQSRAIEAFAKVFLRTREEWRLPDASFCHGLSGLLTIAHQMYLDTGYPLFKAKSNELRSLILSSYHGEWDLGFFPEAITDMPESTRSQKLGLAEGFSGIILALLFHKYSRGNALSSFFVIN